MLSEVKGEVIDVDDSDVFCAVHPDRPPSPLNETHPIFISLLSDSDNEDVSNCPQDNPHGLVLGQLTELQRVTQSELLSRNALRDFRSPLKRTSDDFVSTSDTVRAICPVEVIEISSDSESENRPSKRQRMHERVSSANVPKSEHIESTSTDLCPPSSSDWLPCDSDDDDYMHLLSSLNISDENNWVPLPERNKAEDLTPMLNLDNTTSKPRPISSFRVPRKKPPIDYRSIPFDWTSTSPWGTISKNHGITRFPKPFFRARRQERIFSCRSPNLHHEKGYSKLELTAKYPHLMSGSVNKIIQARDSVVICAVAEGGVEESDDEDDERRLLPENRLGSLVVHHRGRVHMEPAHCHPRRTSRGSAIKYYSISDVAFNPFNPRQFLTAGHDLAVQTWEIPNYDDEVRASLNTIRSISLDSRPQDLVYAPDGSALAITCHDGSIRLCSEDFFEDMIDADLPFKRFQVAPKGSNHATGSTLWGRGPSKHLLFSSSEPKERSDYTGFHRAFDTHKGATVVQFDATESGDAATLSPDGATLVLLTWGKNGTHPLRLYDVRRKLKEAYEMEELEKFKVRKQIGNEVSGDLEEVNQATFSPDGRLLAVARNDNALHVYDVRALSRGPLCQFEHHESDATGNFGVVAATWIQSRDRTGIVSGGDDGCVRLWEPALGCTNGVQGAVIGRTDFDVGHFSVGDPEKGELPLVIGDSGGGVHTYHFTNPDGARL